MSRADAINLGYLVTIVTFILAFEVPLLPGARAAGHVVRRGRNGDRRRGHFRAAGADELLVDPGGHGRFRADRVVRGACGEDDRDAADGGAVQRRRRWGGGTGGAGGVSCHCARSRAAADGELGVERPVRADRQRLLRGEHDRVREAPGSDLRPADHVSRAEGRKPGIAGGAGRDRDRDRRRASRTSGSSSC